MANAVDPEEMLRENLKDAGLGEAEVAACMAMYGPAQKAAVLQKLKAHRRELLACLHEQQDRLDSLDYLIFQLEH